MTETTTLPKRMAAVSLVEAWWDGTVLTVWSGRYRGWSLPGGRVEDGETVEHAQARELREETSLETVELGERVVADVPADLVKDPTRASQVTVFRVKSWTGEPQQSEPYCAVKWMSRDEFLKLSPFGPFYKAIFDQLPQRPDIANAAFRHELRSVADLLGLAVPAWLSTISIEDPTRYVQTLSDIHGLLMSIVDTAPSEPINLGALDAVRRQFSLLREEIRELLGRLPHSVVLTTTLDRANARLHALVQRACIQTTTTLHTLRQETLREQVAVADNLKLLEEKYAINAAVADKAPELWDRKRYLAFVRHGMSIEAERQRLPAPQRAVFVAEHVADSLTFPELQIWNVALEAAASLFDGRMSETADKTADEIRSLKRERE